MEQLDLLKTRRSDKLQELDAEWGRKHARRDDPSTSKQAAVKASKRAPTHADRIYANLKDDGPGTWKQIAYRTGMTEAQVWRRLPDLQKQGRARPTETVLEDCRVWEAV